MYIFLTFVLCLFLLPAQTYANTENTKKNKSRGPFAKFLHNERDDRDNNSKSPKDIVKNVEDHVIKPCAVKYKNLSQPLPAENFNGTSGSYLLSEYRKKEKDSNLRRVFNKNSQNEFLTEKEAEDSAQKSSALVNCLVSGIEQKPQFYFKNTDILIKISGFTDNSVSTLTKFDTVAPLWRGRYNSHGLALQPGFVLSMYSQSRASIDINSGVIYRFVFSRGVLGFNVFLDHSKVFDDGKGHVFHHQRGGAGFDFQTERTYFAANHYFPITNWITVDEYYREHTLGRFDFTFKLFITKKIALSLDFSLQDTSRLDSENEIYSSAGFEYRISCKSSLHTKAKYRSFDDNIWIDFKLSYVIGETHEKEFDECYKNKFRNNLDIWKRIERQRKIRYEVNYELDFKVPQLSISDQTIEVDEHYSITLNRNNFLNPPNDETPQVTVSSKPQWLNYNKQTMTFFGTPEQIGVYQISGYAHFQGVEDPSPWVFYITVEDDNSPH